MRTKCHACLCWTCFTVCCDRKNCIEKKESCKNYIGFRQMSIFEPPSQQNHQSAPRYSWGHYGLDDKLYRKKLYMMCQSGKYDSIIRVVAYRTNKDIAPYLVKSVTQNKSYDKIEFDGELGRICVGKSDFYGYRRLFYSLLDMELRRIEK